MIWFSCLLLILLPLIACGSDVKNLTSINGFEAGMELERFESNLGIAVDHFFMLDPSLTVRDGYKVWKLGKCMSKDEHLGYCSERKQANLAIGGVEVSAIYYHPKSKSIRFDLLSHDYGKSGPEFNYQKWKDAQELVNYLTNQHEHEWTTHHLGCGVTGCATEHSLHQGDGRFITVGRGTPGAKYVFIRLSSNSEGTNRIDF